MCHSKKPLARNKIAWGFWDPQTSPHNECRSIPSSKDVVEPHSPVYQCWSRKDELENFLWNCGPYRLKADSREIFRSDIIYLINLKVSEVCASHFVACTEGTAATAHPVVPRWALWKQAVMSGYFPSWFAPCHLLYTTWLLTAQAVCTECREKKESWVPKSHNFPYLA